MRAVRMGLAMLLMAVPAGAGAQNLAATKRVIAELEDAWIQAVIKRDAAAFDRLLAPSFVYTEDDRVYTRAELIREMTSGSDTVRTGRNEDLSVRVYGNMAVATGWLVLRGRGAKGPFERRYRYTDTWLRTSTRWVVVAAHDYLKP